MSPEGDDRLTVNELMERLAENGQSSAGTSNPFLENFVANLDVDDNADCPICFSEIENPVVVPGCMHQLYVITPDNIDDFLRLYLVAKTVSYLILAYVRERSNRRTVRLALLVLSRYAIILCLPVWILVYLTSRALNC